MANCCTYNYYFLFNFVIVIRQGWANFKLGAGLLKYLTDSNLLLIVSESAITNSRDRVSPGFQLSKVYMQGCGGY